jgi:hypothetical protein
MKVLLGIMVERSNLLKSEKSLFIGCRAHAWRVINASS